MRLTSLFALAVISAIWNDAAAQATYDIDELLDSIRAPYSSEVTYSGVIQMETINATTGKPVLTGTALKLPAINLISDSVLLFNLVGSKTIATTISGVRGTFTATPAATSGWEQVAPWAVRKKFATPVLLPIGQFLGCRYDMPAQKLSIASLAVTSWTTLVNVVTVAFGGPVQEAKITLSVVKGNLRCKVGMKAADIPAPAPPVVAPPVVPPPVVPPLPPPPPAGVSPDGSVITVASGGSLTTAAGVWTFGTATGAGGNVILLNGAQAGSGEATELFVLSDGNLYAFNAFANWFQWVGTGWSRLPVAPVGAPHP